MTVQDPSVEEVARRGNELYEREVRAKGEPGNKGRLVAIDIDSGAYGLGEDEIAAADQVRLTHPDARIWFVRIGYPAVHRMRRYGRAMQR